MNKQVYSNEEFTKLKERLNQEIKRRGTYKWFDPLCTPSVGTDKSSPVSLPDTGERVLVDDLTYTINNPSEGSIEPTRNITHPAHGENPAGSLPDHTKSIPSTSAAQFNTDELKNMIVGLSKIQDINLFYGRDEVKNTAFRDPQGIVDVLESAEGDQLNALLHESDISPTKNDPNGGVIDQRNDNYPIENHSVTYPMEDGIYVMPSGETDGEEVSTPDGLGPHNFYDDYGAQPGDANYHPYNRYTSLVVNRDWNIQDNHRNITKKRVRPGGVKSKQFGQNPRNPEEGNPYPSRPVYGGKESSCNNACTGLCHVTCDDECSESCTTTCWNRCGEACTATCGNICTGCSTLCRDNCKTKCETISGYSCVKSGVKAVKITTSGGVNGEPAVNTVKAEYHTCDGCSYSCQFYPNKKTECWDAGCTGKCFASCSQSCSQSCFGGCINNQKQVSENDGYKTGKGQGCSSGCTLNCIGTCATICESYCTQTCWNICTSNCNDNCVFTCATNCGSGCAQGCRLGCTGCQYSCKDGAKNRAEQKSCTGCSFANGCRSECQSDCNRNCMGWGCRSICGTDGAGACDANCRMNCTAASCTANCSDACSSQCNTCVNTCGFQCGACSSLCSTGCESVCNINCTEECENSCNGSCNQSCSEECGGCSDLCYSCVGKCIGICSVKCDQACSSCSKLCGWWCDSSCNRTCFANCSTWCINSCVGTCATFLMSETLLTVGPERQPTSVGFIYPNPKNRWEERESFKLFRDPEPYKMPAIVPNDKLCTVLWSMNERFIIIEVDEGKPYERVYQALDINSERIVTNDITLDKSRIKHIWKYKYGDYNEITYNKLRTNDFIYVYDSISLGEFNPKDIPAYLKKKNDMIIVGPSDLEYIIRQTTIDGGIYSYDMRTGEIVINEDVMNGVITSTEHGVDGGDGIWILQFFKGKNNKYNLRETDFLFKLPWEFEVLKAIVRDDDIIFIIQLNKFLFPEEEDELNGKNN